MPTVDLEGRAVHYVETGSGPPVMMLHAGGSSGRQWRKVVESLGDGYRVILPDLIGFGETDVWQGPDELTHDDQAAVARGLVTDAGAEAGAVENDDRNGDPKA